MTTDPTDDVLAATRHARDIWRAKAERQDAEIARLTADRDRWRSRALAPFEEGTSDPAGDDHPWGTPE